MTELGTLLAAALLSSCTFSVPLNPTIDSPPGIVQLPLAMGVYYSPEFRAYEYVERVGLHAESQFVRPVGRASMALFERVFPLLFESVLSVSSRPPLGEGQPELAAVIDPRIEELDMGPPNFGMGWGPVVWTEITYRFTVYSPEGDRIASWTVTGMGEAKMRVFRERQALGQTTDLAMQDAASKFMSVFRTIPEIRQWLRRIEVLSAR